MDRKNFIRTCGLACLSFTGLISLEGCAGSKYVNAAVNNNAINIPEKEFLKENSTKYRRTLIVKTAAISFPIVVYRFSATEYRALLLSCTHQQVELNVSGDLLTCPAHGSEFNNQGNVTQGPAEQSLKQYTVTVNSDQIYIHLT